MTDTLIYTPLPAQQKDSQSLLTLFYSNKFKSSIHGIEFIWTLFIFLQINNKIQKERNIKRILVFAYLYDMIITAVITIATIYTVLKQIKIYFLNSSIILYIDVGSTKIHTI